MYRILVLCTGNSARSQMAEGLLTSFDSGLQVCSAGIDPAQRVSPFAIQVMHEIGIDISTHAPKGVDQFIDQPFDYLITVCDNARETCPVFIGEVKHRLHFGFPDPAEASGTDAEILSVYRRIRDEIKSAFYRFYIQTLIRE